MGTIFVAYGEPGHRNEILRFGASQAAASDHDLFVYHIHESPDETARDVEAEIESAVREVAPDLEYDVQINTREEYSDETNVSKQKRLSDAILQSGRDFEYVVMGDVERGSLDEFAHASMTKTVLETHAVPVLLVPV